MNDTAFVTRFAPSPTGYLHLGNAYSALVVQDAARAAGGRLLLRVEDIDQRRCRPELEAAMLEDLAWLGLTWEEPVRRQSEHFTLYRDQLQRLTVAGLTYPCFCTRREIRLAVEASGAPIGPEGPVYPGTCRDLSAADRIARQDAGEAFAVRLDMATALQRVGGGLTWRDLDAGTQPCQAARFGDVVLARKDTPTSYHMAVTIDDALQGISHVIRGQDLFEASHVHRLLQALLNLPTPVYRHHPLIADDAGIRLAKAKRSPSIRDVRGQGIAPADLRALVGL
jgi:glutamyl-Q tRNA(Asp) synthetase